MLKAVVVDDEVHALERIKELVIVAENLTLTGSFQQAENFLEEIEAGTLPEVVFLDIEMPGTNGLELAVNIQDIDQSIDIIFITAYKDYAVDAFELNALDYLLKPITQDRFKQAIARLEDKNDMISNKKGHLKINAFGKFDLIYQDQEFNLDWPTSKCEELFLYLLQQQGEFEASDKLAEELWPDRKPQKAVDILYTTVYSLRNIFSEAGFEQIIESKRGYYRLNLNQVQSALIEFEKITAKVKEEYDDSYNQLERLIELYQGNYLEQKDYLWVYNIRSGLERQFKETLLKAADYYFKQSENQRAKHLLKSIIERDFLFEPAQEKLIEVYKEQNKEELAKMQYQQFKTRLRQELGLEPDFDYKNNNSKS
ncbi:MAG: response regulator [Halanaerobium sp.]